MDVSAIMLICPNCKKPIPANQALTTQFSEKIRKEFETQREQEREEERKKMLAWQEEQKRKISANNDLEIKALKEENEHKAQELKKSREKEYEFLQEKKSLKEKIESVNLEVARKVDEQFNKIRETTQIEDAEKYRLREKEYEQNMAAMKKSLEEAQRKASQGSQQLQGEVLEIELERILKQEFPIDEIVPVPKGVAGADVIQKVKDLNGRDCGVIIWESKRTKNWTEGWIQKLKDDQRATKADVAIIVSSVLPEGVKNFGTQDGIHIASFDSFINLAKLVRSSLVDLHKTKLSTVDKSNKMEIIYAYLSGNEFRQRFEAIIEAFTGMKGDLEKEKLLYTKVWAKREKQIQKVVDNTVGMYGDLQGLMGASLPEIKLLDTDIELLESPEE